MTLEEIKNRSKSFVEENYKENSTIERFIAQSSYVEGLIDGEQNAICLAMEWVEFNNKNGGCDYDNWRESLRKTMMQGG